MADRPNAPDPEAVMKQAEATALFFRRLLDEGVPLHTASTLAGRCAESLVTAWAIDRLPGRPWEE